MTNLSQIETWIASGESEVLEFKRTSGELRAGTRTACAMLKVSAQGFVRTNGPIAIDDVHVLQGGTLGIGAHITINETILVGQGGKLLGI